MTNDDSSSGNEDEEGAFALPPEREYPRHEDRLERLPPDFQEGWSALEEHPQAEPHIVTVTDDDAPGGGNFVFISLGRIHVGRFGYNHDRCEVFVRVNATFPRGQKYGFATAEKLQQNGSTPDSTDMNRDQAEPLCSALGVDEVQYWSRNWNYMNIDQQDPTELSKAIAWTKTVLSEPFPD